MTKEEIKDLRKELGITQQELADRLGLTVDTIRSWESGYRNPSGSAKKLLEIIRKTLLKEDG